MDIRLAKSLLSNIDLSQRRSKHHRGKCFDIHINEYDLLDIYHEQKGLCYWSGLSLMPEYNKIRYHPFGISSERLNCLKPYERSNVVLCRRIFNLGRSTFSENDFPSVIAKLREEFKNQNMESIIYQMNVHKKLKVANTLIDFME